MTVSGHRWTLKQDLLTSAGRSSSLQSQLSVCGCHTHTAHRWELHPQNIVPDTSNIIKFSHVADLISSEAHCPPIPPRVGVLFTCRVITGVQWWRGSTDGPTTGWFRKCWTNQKINKSNEPISYLQRRWLSSTNKDGETSTEANRC